MHSLSGCYWHGRGERTTADYQRLLKTSSDMVGGWSALIDLVSGAVHILLPQEVIEDTHGDGKNVQSLTGEREDDNWG